MESIVVWNNIQLRTRIPMVSPIFHARVVCGRHQIRGNARGPTEQTAMIIKDFRKYHGIFSSAKRGGGGGIQKLTAVFALYSVVLNIFSAEGALFHYHLSW